MGEVVNLRLARKAHKRAAAQAEADTNRALFGRTKGDRARDAAEAQRAAKALEGAKREDG